MELDITQLANDYDYIQAYTPIYGSVATLGQGAAKLTWNNAKHNSPFYMFVTEENHQDIRDHFKEYGAWEKEEIDAWNFEELNALLLQDIFSSLTDYLENEDTENFEEWQGNFGGRIFRSDDKKLFYYVGM